MTFISSPDDFTQLTAAALEATDFLFLWNPNTTLLPKMQLFAVSQLLVYLNNVYRRIDHLWPSANMVLMAGTDRKTMARTITTVGPITIESIGDTLRFTVTPGAVLDATNLASGGVVLNSAGPNLVYRKPEVDTLVAALNSSISTINGAITTLNAAVAAINVSPGANLSGLNLTDTELIGITTSDGQLQVAGNAAAAPLTVTNTPRTPANYPAIEVLNMASVLRLLTGVVGATNTNFNISPNSVMTLVNSGWVNVTSGFPTTISAGGLWTCSRAGKYRVTFTGTVWAGSGSKINTVFTSAIKNGANIGAGNAPVQAVSSGLEFAPAILNSYVDLVVNDTLGIGLQVFPFGTASGVNQLSSFAYLRIEPVSLL